MLACEQETAELSRKMSLRDAVHILMLSPIYFYLPVPQRLLLAKEYCLAANSFRR
ncbi:hypothetical protein [Candidatus Electronema sp. TJ]|uniref:hypothetical protein n=1 Tax=Candidatus Electronema sp. TJ TaxID=3401573 RepID=UPI003AA9072A